MGQIVYYIVYTFFIVLILKINVLLLFTKNFVLLNQNRCCVSVHVCQMKLIQMPLDLVTTGCLFMQCCARGQMLGFNPSVVSLNQ